MIPTKYLTLSSLASSLFAFWHKIAESVKVDLVLEKTFDAYTKKKQKKNLKKNLN